jgi:hypothetical protein
MLHAQFLLSRFDQLSQFCFPPICNLKSKILSLPCAFSNSQSEIRNSQLFLHAPCSVLLTTDYLFLFVSDQFLAVEKRSIPLDPIMALPFQNPAALLLAAERKTKWGEGEIRVVMNHAEVFLESYLV